jgi:hypothetical protein
VGAVVDDDGDTAPGGIRNGGADVVVLVDEAAAQVAGLVELDETDELAVEVGEREEAVAGPGDVGDVHRAGEDLAGLAAVFDEVGAVVVAAGGDVLGDGGGAAVRAPGEPAPASAAVEPALDLAGLEVQHAEHPVGLAAGVEGETDPAPVGGEDAVAVDGAGVAGDGSQAAAGADQGELPGLVAAAVLAHEEAEGGLAHGQQAVLPGREADGEAVRPGEAVGLGDAGHVGSEPEPTGRGRRGPKGASDAEELGRRRRCHACRLRSRAWGRYVDRPSRAPAGGRRRAGQAPPGKIGDRPNTGE